MLQWLLKSSKSTSTEDFVKAFAANEVLNKQKSIEPYTTFAIQGAITPI